MPRTDALYHPCLQRGGHYEILPFDLFAGSEWSDMVSRGETLGTTLLLVRHWGSNDGT